MYCCSFWLTYNSLGSTDLPHSGPVFRFFEPVHTAIKCQKYFRTACYDCHSYETTYPWCSNVQPLGRWLQGHIDEGRDEINLSLWHEYFRSDADHLLEEIIKVIEEEKMPLPPYTLDHLDARLTD